MKIKIYNIDWDTDGEDIDLPAEETFEIDDDYIMDNIEEEMNDYLSEKYGYCVDGYFSKIIKERGVTNNNKTKLDNVQLLIEDVLAMNFCEDNLEQYIKYLDKDLDDVEKLQHNHEIDHCLANHLIEEIELLKDIINTIYKGEE